VHAHRFQVTAESLAYRYRAGQPASLGERRSRAGEPRGQRASVEHHVRDPWRGTGAQHALVSSRGPVAGQDRGQRRVQVGDDDRQAGQVIRIAQHVVEG
jgi:hypothetical protein